MESGFEAADCKTINGNNKTKIKEHACISSDVFGLQGPKIVQTVSMRLALHSLSVHYMITAVQSSLRCEVISWSQ